MPRKPEIILASASPRRSELLALIGLKFAVKPSEVDETLYQNEPAVDYITRLARSKARAIASALPHGTDALVIGADTVVVIGETILGKPADENDARRMLGLLSGVWHEVMTGVALHDAGSGRDALGHTVTRVKFASLTSREIDWYIDSGDCADKAGAYAIQGAAGLFIEEITGNYHNVVGLPLPLVYRLARQLDVDLI